MFKVETLTTDEAIASIVAKMKVLRADEDDSNEGSMKCLLKSWFLKF